MKFVYIRENAQFPRLSFSNLHYFVKARVISPTNNSLQLVLRHGHTAK